MGFIGLYMYFIALSFLASLVIYLKPKTSYLYLKFFPPFLLLTFCVELIGSYMLSIKENNVVLYNFFSTIEFCFYLLILSIIIISRKIKKIIWITTSLYTTLAVINIVFIQKIRTFHTITYSLGCLLIVIFCINYFLELFRNPKSEKLYLNPAFWICAALLFFYICGFPLYALIIYWDTEIPKIILNNLKGIFTILNISLYSLFTIAFLCIRIKKYTSSPS